MKIVHFAPFAPNRAGLYEAARDMMRADCIMGHNCSLVDTGIFVNGKQEAGRIGQEDNRAGFFLETESPDVAKKADLLIYHSGVPDLWTVKCQAPIIMVIHGRPLAAYRFEHNTGIASYSLYAEVASWPRVKKVLHFWPEFQNYWRAIISEEKLLGLRVPPVDRERFSMEGPVYKIPGQYSGRYNGLICDSWREDVDIFEIAHGALEAARQIQGLTWHFYAVDATDGAWKRIFDAFRSIGAMGEVYARQSNMEERYRAYDFLLSPQRIYTRTIAEALCCGLPVVSPRTDGFDAADTVTTAFSISEMVRLLEKNFHKIRLAVRDESEIFDLKIYGSRMDQIYGNIQTGEPVAMGR